MSTVPPARPPVKPGTQPALSVVPAARGFPGLPCLRCGETDTATVNLGDVLTFACTSCDQVTTATEVEEHLVCAGGLATFARFGPREPPPRQHPFGSGHAALSARLPVALRLAAFASWGILCPPAYRSASRPPSWSCQARTGLLRSARPRRGRGGSALCPGARCPPRGQGKPPRSWPAIAVQAPSGDLS
jgi:hypothetical protein